MSDGLLNLTNWSIFQLEPPREHCPSDRRFSRENVGINIVEESMQCWDGGKTGLKFRVDKASANYTEISETTVVRVHDSLNKDTPDLISI